MDDSLKIYTKKTCVEDFIRVRNTTLKLTQNLSAEDMVIQTNDFVSPTKWHLGHTTWFFENFLLIPFLNKYKSFSKDFNFIFNSYYNSLGEFNSKEKRGFLSRPSIDEVIKYRKYVDENLLHLFSKVQPNSRNFLLQLGINHEQQHQELILMDIKNVFFSNPLKPSFTRITENQPQKKIDNSFTLKSPKKFTYGSNKKSFFYDNELPNSIHRLQPFKLSSYITNSDWKAFIKDGGYESHEYWLSDGWDFIKKNSVKRPLYWIDESHQFTLNGVKKIDNSLPVSHISLYEAFAFAKYKKSRLPTEFEIEYLLGRQKIRGNLLEDNRFSEVDYCNSFHKDCLYGNLWIWTSSNYLPYKNYKPYKNQLMEYNSKFMCNQFVLKGGSFSTPKSHIRSSYRNFYYPSDRWQFSGLRLVREI